MVHLLASWYWICGEIDLRVRSSVTASTRLLVLVRSCVKLDSPRGRLKSMIKGGHNPNLCVRRAYTHLTL